MAPPIFQIGNKIVAGVGCCEGRALVECCDRLLHPVDEISVLIDMLAEQGVFALDQS